jgi:hypothetical protein
MTVVRKFWRNRKESKEWARRLQSEDPGLMWFILSLRELMWGAARIPSPCGRIEMQDQYAGLSGLQLTCIV